ncbi:FAD-dependent monooxygenase [Streptomyces caatingaensis]|uniref:Monooxygenase n=1 Tax=Streptomyces caatingaensis TaxID=1678637 RepID=A0A0K9XC79_9ACTN|nr:FAD-dependent monooxygenase [Streptomyces caatingaensis]KNB50803.1 monooxygenase [Streptomyces caatingaensis]
MSGILVVGGGVAGSAAGLALRQAGFEVTVHEAHPQTGADIGAFLTLASNGMQALAQIGAAGPVTGHGFPVTGMRFVDESGARLESVPLGEDAPLLRYRCMRRAELGAALQEEARRRGVPFRWSARLVSVEEDDERVTARFSDGSSATGDLLVGADGLRSAVRAHLDPAARPVYAGQSIFYGYTRDPAAGACLEPDRLTMIRASRVLFGCLVSPAGETYWFARLRGPAVGAEEAAVTPPGTWRDRLVALLRPDRSPAADIVRATEDKLMVTNAVRLTPGVRWCGRRVVLVGDAAHAAPPATGQGASMAFEDAVVLAKALRDAPHRQAALERYERHRRPRAERNIAVSALLTASGPPDWIPVATARRPRSPLRRLSHLDEGLRRLLDWHTPLPA